MAHRVGEILYNELGDIYVTTNYGQNMVLIIWSPDDDNAMEITIDVKMFNARLKKTSLKDIVDEIKDNMLAAYEQNLKCERSKARRTKIREVLG
jgi:hypothetical protein